MQTPEQPITILLTGPNGAGKTTFRQKFLEQNPVFSGFISLNWDEETIKYSITNPEISKDMARINAGKIIINKTQNCFTQHKSFIYETLAADHRHLRIITTAKKTGYKIVTVFIGLASPELSKIRVKHRVENGGHNVNNSDIEARYPKIMANFPTLFDQSDTCFVIDNSGKNYKLILLKSNNLNITFNKFPNYLSHDKFDLSSEKQSDGSILLTNSQYIKKSQAEKQQIIQHLLESFSTKNK